MPSAANVPPLFCCGELFLGLQITHEQAAAFRIEAQIVHAQHPHAEADLGANRIQGRIKRFLGDAQLGDAHGHDAFRRRR